jgi:hypothetical protein
MRGKMGKFPGIHTYTSRFLQPQGKPIRNPGIIPELKRRTMPIGALINII